MWIIIPLLVLFGSLVADAWQTFIDSLGVVV